MDRKTGSRCSLAIRPDDPAGGQTGFLIHRPHFGAFTPVCNDVFCGKIDSRLIQIDQPWNLSTDSIVSNGSLYIMNLYKLSHALSQCYGAGPANIYSTPFSIGTRACSPMDIDTSKLGRLDTKEAEQL